MHPLSPSAGVGVEPPTKFPKRGGLTGSPFLEQGGGGLLAGKEWGELFQGGCSFT